MNASKMMARMATTTQKKNTMMPGTAYPATVLALATTASYPPPRILFGAENRRQSDDFRTIGPRLPLLLVDVDSPQPRVAAVIAEHILSQAADP
jgi:hypothetical protein